MTRTFAIALAGAALLAGATSAQAQMSGLQSLPSATPKASLIHKTGRRARRRAGIAAGLALGLVGAVAAAEAYEAQAWRERRWWRRERRCRRWRRWCHRGNERACWRYDTRC